MKKRIFSRAFALFMALSLLSTTAFAANATHTDLSGNVVEGDVETFLGGATGVQEGTVTLTTDVTVSTDNGQGMTALSLNPGVNFDLGGYTLTVEKGTQVNQYESYGVPTSGIVTNGQNNISNGTIAVGEDISVGIYEMHNQASLNDIEMEAKSDDTTLIRTNDGITLTDCTLDASKIVDGDSDVKRITFVSGVYDNLSDALDGKNKNFKLAEGSGSYEVISGEGENDEPGTGEEPAKKNPTVIISKDTAAVVVDKDGNIKLYDSLEEAKEAVGDGATVNVVNGLTKAPEGYEIADGKLVVKAEEVEEPGTEPVEPTPNPPVVVPGIEGPGEMSASVSGPAAVEVGESDIPLAGLITRAQLISYLYEHEGSPDGADAEGEYTLAMAWAVANGIVDEEDAPEEIVTVAILKDVMTNYAAYLDAAFDVAVEGEEDMVVMNCDEILAEFYASVEDPAA